MTKQKIAVFEFNFNNLYSSDSILSVFLILQINYLKFMNTINYYISYIYDKITAIENTRNYFSGLTISIISGINHFRTFIPVLLFFTFIFPFICSPFNVYSSDPEIAKNLIKTSYDYFKEGNKQLASEMLQRSYEITNTIPEYYYISNLLFGNDMKTFHDQESNAEKIVKYASNSFMIEKYDLLKQCAVIYGKTHRFRKSLSLYEQLFSIETSDHKQDYLDCVGMLFHSELTADILPVLGEAKRYFDSPDLDYYSLLYGVLHARPAKKEFDAQLLNLTAKNYPAVKLLYLKALYGTNGNETFNEYSSLSKQAVDPFLKKNIIHSMLTNRGSLNRAQMTGLLQDWIASGGLSDSRTDGLLSDKYIFDLINTDKSMKDPVLKYSGERYTDNDEDGNPEEYFIYKNGRAVQAVYDTDQNGINESVIKYFDDGNIDEYDKFTGESSSEKYFFNRLNRSLESVEFYSNGSMTGKFVMKNSALFPKLSEIGNIKIENLLPYVNLAESGDVNGKKQVKYYNGSVQYEYFDSDNNGYYEYRKFYVNGSADHAVKDVDQDGIFEIREEYKNGKLTAVYSMSDENSKIYDYKEMFSDNGIEKYWDSNSDGIYEMKITENKDAEFKYFDINFDGIYDFVLESRNNSPERLYEIKNGKRELMKNYAEDKKISVNNWLILSVRKMSDIEIPDGIDLSKKIFTYKNKKQFFENNEIKNGYMNFRIFIHKNEIYLIDMMR
jgi:hypothetical protein